jgi:hypothetical protein
MDMTPVSPALLPSHWGLDALRCGLTKKRLQEGELKNFLSNEILWLVVREGLCEEHCTAQGEPFLSGLTLRDDVSLDEVERILI